LVLAATAVQPAAALAAFVAATAAQLCARALAYRIDAIDAGYYGTNAILLGLAIAIGRPLGAPLVLEAILAGVAAAAVTAVLGDLLHRGAALPLLALPFVVLAPVLVGHHAYVAPDGLAAITLPVPAALDIVLRSAGAIVFSPTHVAGLAILLALLVSSRIALALALAGIGVAHAMAAGLDAPATVVLLMSYNAALTAIAIGAVFFVPGKAALVAGAAAAAVASWVTVGVTALFAPIGAPVLAWPFVAVTLAAIRALHLRAPDRAPFPSPLPGQTPEANLAYAAARAARFALPGPPQIGLPFFGAWTVTQGVDGAHTHQGAWAHALDFEVFDAEGFPFRNRGEALDDYLCFGLPVVAPASGTVAAVHDGAADQPPGELDPGKPWGNAVVLHVGAELYVVLAHLKRGSITVVPGQVVALGQPIAACGSSGRSPRPHLHLQVQRTIELGAAAIPFALGHYLVEGAARRYVHVGVPVEGERITSPEVGAIASGFAALPVGDELELTADDGTTTRLVSELSLLGERSLRDRDRGDRLYFTVAAGALTFTAHTGPADAPLRALLRAMPRLPLVAGSAVYTDRVPPAAVLGRAARIVHDVVRVVGDPLDVRAELALTEEPAALVVTSAIHAGVRGRARIRHRGRAVLDRDGLRTLELADGDVDPAVTPRLRLRRRA
ncbi:MAG: urea transporter, partial [Deltaproteobacteria bacterium]|nr:urea transporter [Deltaproteobacteria bacterium]